MKTSKNKMKFLNFYPRKNVQPEKKIWKSVQENFRLPKKMLENVGENYFPPKKKAKKSEQHHFSGTFHFLGEKILVGGGVLVWYTR